MNPPIDKGRIFDWGRTSQDYGRYRPGYPDGFFDKLQAFDIGLPGQAILDMGTGTGVLARGFAGNGCKVTGVDNSENQIGEARRLASEDNLEIAFFIASAEDTGQPDNAFDIVTAGQSWLYFDFDRAVEEARRVLRPDGVVVMTYLNWLPLRDPVAERTEGIVLKYNPDWTGGGWDGDLAPTLPGGKFRQHFNLKAALHYVEPIPFTRDSWIGRMHACRGIGATLDEPTIVEFDETMRDMLEKKIAGESFDILHQIDVYILDLK